MLRNSRDPTPPETNARINVGDVGFIRRGKFHLLFSAGFPLKDRQLGDDVPSTFEPLNVDVKTLDFGLPREPDCLHTDSVRQFGVGAGASASSSLCAISFRISSSILKYVPPRPLEAGASFSYELTEDFGAALVTEYSTYTTDTLVEGFFKEYTERHYKSWIEFTRKKGYGKDVQPVLVTGFDVTRDFAMVAYSHQGTSLKSDLTMTVPVLASASASLWGTWHARCTPHTNRGPQGCNPLPPEQTIEPSSSQSAEARKIPVEFNQCVFIRYFTMRWRLGIFPKFIKARAGPHDLGSGDNKGDAFPELTTQVDVESATGGGDDLRGQRGPITDGGSSEQGVFIRNTPSVRFL